MVTAPGEVTYDVLRVRVHCTVRVTVGPRVQITVHAAQSAENSKIENEKENILFSLFRVISEIFS